MANLQIPAGKVDMEGLVLLAAGLEKLTGGGRVEVKQMVVIETENMPALWALEDMLSKDFMKALPGQDTKALPEGKRVKTASIDDAFNDVPVCTLFDEHPPKKAKKAPDRGKNIHKRQGNPGVPKVKSYLVRACAIPKYVGQKYSGNTVGKLIKTGHFPPGTRFHHPNKGNLVVSSDHILIHDS